MAFVYRHRRNDTNEIFYIGIGKRKSRLYSKYSRNIYWKNITSKTDYTAEILLDNIEWDEACELEILLIEQYGRKKDGGCLCNITIGGDGSKGFKHTKKFIQSMKDRKGYKHTDKTKELISKGHLGKKLSIEHKLKLSKCKKGKKTGSKTNSKPVLQLNLNNKIVNSFKSITEASKITNIHFSNIARSASKDRKTAGGFIWKYKKL